MKVDPRCVNPDNLKIAKEELNELNSVIAGIIGGDPTKEVQASHFFEPVQACAHDPFFIGFSEYLARGHKEYFEKLPFRPLSIILGWELSMIWAKRITDINPLESSFLLLFGENSGQLYDDLFHSYTELNTCKRYRKHVDMKEYESDGLVDEEYAYIEEHLDEYAQIYRSSSDRFGRETVGLFCQGGHCILLQKVISELYKRVLMVCIEPTLFQGLAGKYSSVVLTTYRQGIKDGIMSVNCLLCNYDIASLRIVLKRTEKPDAFASWYQKSEEFACKILVPIILAKATLEKNDELVKVVRPLLTKEVEAAFSELLKVADNHKFLLLVSDTTGNGSYEDDDYWALPIDYIIFRGKEIYNILHPEDQQQIPIDMEQVRLAIAKENPKILPPLPDSYSDMPQNCNRALGVAVDNKPETIVLPWMGTTPKNNWTEEQIGIFCKVFASHCQPNDPELIKYFFWGKTKPEGWNVKKIGWEIDEKGKSRCLELFVSFVRYIYRTYDKNGKVHINNIPNVKKINEVFEISTDRRADKYDEVEAQLKNQGFPGIE